MSLFRYAAIGAVATGSHYLILVGLVEGSGLSATAASFIGACVGAGVAFFGQRALTFVNRPRTAAALPRFLVVAAMGAILNSVIVWVGSTAGLHYLVAQFIATLLIVYLTYHLNSVWSFA